MDSLSGRVESVDGRGCRMSTCRSDLRCRGTRSHLDSPRDAPAGRPSPPGRHLAPLGISSASKTFLIAAIRRSSSAIAASSDQGTSGAAIAAASG